MLLLFIILQSGNLWGVDFSSVLTELAIDETMVPGSPPGHVVVEESSKDFLTLRVHLEQTYRAHYNLPM